MGIDSVSRAAVFLDRDGVIVEEVFYPEFGEREAPMRPEDVRVLPGAASAMRQLSDLGFFLVLVSNQGAVAKGKIDLRSLWRTHERIIDLLAEEGAKFDAEYYSFSHPDGIVSGFSGPSLDRKPSPYNLLVAAGRYELDLSRSWMIGDRETDVVCGRAAGTKTIRIFAAESNRATSEPSDAEFRAKSLFDCVEIVSERANTVVACSREKIHTDVLLTDCRNWRASWRDTIS
jgi:D-glycero-D-manno-heptose 1,7-bisphosphate phosphatase